LYTSEVTPKAGVLAQDASLSSISLWIHVARRLGRHQKEEGGLKELEEGRCKQDMPIVPMPLKIVELDIREETFSTKVF
jgi:hypothetical protein